MSHSDSEKQSLTSLEKRSISALALVYGLRMFGLFLILPVLAVYAEQLQGSTATLMGLAMGVYGMTQAILQIPFGVLSDRFGRKPVLFVGLLIFALGGVIAACASSIWGVIIGRSLQGAGAIAAVVLALTSDLTRENQRTKAMAFIGMSIGLSFLLALIAAPFLQSLIGVKGLFLLTSILALLAILLIYKAVPTPTQSFNLEVRAVPEKMLELLKHPQLIRLDLGVFVLHFVLTAMFVVVPIILHKQLDLPTQEHWKVYVPALLLSIVFLLPMIIKSANKEWLQRIFIIAIAILCFAQCLFIWRPEGVIGITVCLFFFFWGFNLLESMLPSLISRIAPAASKGSAMGVYNTFQFLGVFFGGLLGGALYGRYGVNAVFALSAAALLLWVVLVKTMPALRLLDSMVVKLNDHTQQTDLLAVNGVEEAIVIADQATAYLKVDKSQLDNGVLSTLIQA